MISGKNIAEVLKKNRFEDIKNFFKNFDSRKDRVEFLKKLFGISGWATPKRGDFIDMAQYEGSGITFFKRSEYREESIKLKWTEVVERIEEIIEKENQMTLF